MTRIQVPRSRIIHKMAEVTKPDPGSEVVDRWRLGGQGGGAGQASKRQQVHEDSGSGDVLMSCQCHHNRAKGPRFRVWLVLDPRRDEHEQQLGNDQQRENCNRRIFRVNQDRSQQTKSHAAEIRQ